MSIQTDRIAIDRRSRSALHSTSAGTRAALVSCFCAVFASTLAACERVETDTDAGVDAGAVEVIPDAGPNVAPPPEVTPPAIPWLEDGAPPIAPPEIPWLEDGAPPLAAPQLTPCPSGWREVPPASAAEVATCEPYPTGGPAACPAGSAHFPGDAACVVVGSPCPAGEWPSGLPATGVVYVRAAEPAGGDGSAASPFGRVSDALAVVPTGGTVVLARGTYDEALRILQPVTLRGACAAETSLRTSATDAGAAIVAEASDVFLRDLRVGDSPVPGLLVTGSASSMHADGVVVERATRLGVSVIAGTFVGDSLVVRETASDLDGTFGRGVTVEAAGEARLSRALIERNREVGVLAEGTGTVLHLEDTVVQDTQSMPMGSRRGLGLRAHEGATVTVQRALFLRNRTIGVFARGAGTTVRLEDTIIRDTLELESDRSFGRGMTVQRGASLEVVRGLLERNRGAGVVAIHADTTLRLEDTIVRGTVPQLSDRQGGFAVSVEEEASGEVVRAHLIENTAGVFAWMDATVRLTDTVVRDSRTRPDGTGGRGLEIATGASASVLRGVFVRNRREGITADAATLRLEDVIVADTRSRDGGGFGRGINLQREGSAEAVRVLVEGNNEVGVYVHSSTARLQDVIVRDTVGRGIEVNNGSTVDAVRAVFARNQQLGIAVFNERTAVRLEDVVVRETQSYALRLGRGINLHSGSSVELVRGLIEGNTDVGIYAADVRTAVRLEDVVVRDTQARDDDGTAGRALEVQLGASADGTRVLFERNREVAVYVFAPGSEVQLRDAVVRDTLSAACGADCPFGAGGMAAGAYQQATLGLERFILTRAEVCGVQIAARGFAELRDGEVSECEIGACVQVENFPLRVLSEGVLYRDNAANIESTTFPAPIPGEAAVGG